jgi:hypothetical protein
MYLGNNGEPLSSRQIETYYPAALTTAGQAHQSAVSDGRFPLTL